MGNGGMMIWYLLGRYPKMFNAVSPVYGVPIVNTTVIKNHLRNVDLLRLHDRSDRTVPMDGVSEDGWIYDSLNTIIEQWGRLQMCKLQMGLRKFITPYDVGER